MKLTRSILLLAAIAALGTGRPAFAAEPPTRPPGGEQVPPTTPPTYTAATANPTGDGVPNIMKYALGLNPLTKASEADLPSIQPKTNNTVDFNFTRMRDATDIIYQVERRWDLM